MAEGKDNRQPKDKKRKKEKEIVENRLVKALGHPIRARTLAIFNERVASPKEVAGMLGLPVSKLSYHVGELVKYKCIELVGTKKRRGATEHFYRGTTRSFLSDTNWEQLSPEAKTGVSIAGMKMIVDAAKAAFKAETFDSRADRHLSCTPVVVDDQGWTDLSGLLAATLERVMDIQAESAERLVKAKADGTPATISILGFESPPCEPEAEAEPPTK